MNVATRERAIERADFNTPSVQSELMVVVELFDAQKTLSKIAAHGEGPSDTDYSTAVLRQALSRLRGALSNMTGGDGNELVECAARIEECRLLSARCRDVLADTLRRAAVDTSKLPICVALLEAALGMLAVRVLYDIASDGFDTIATTVALAIESHEAVH